MRRFTSLLFAVLACISATAQVTVPDGATYKDFMYVYNRSGYVIGVQSTKIAFDGSDAYLDVTAEGDWVKGTWDGTKAVFPSKQQVRYNLYFMAANYVATNISTSGTLQTSYKYTALDSLVLTYSENGDTLRPAANTAALLSEAQDVSPFNVRPNRIYISPDWIVAPDKVAVPADPTFVKTEDGTAFDQDAYSETYGYGLIRYYQPYYDVNNNLLNLNKLYLNVYLDDSTEPMVFTKDTYKSLDSDVVNLPYEYDDDDDFEYWVTGNGRHALAFYTADVERIGLQSVYMGGGVEKRSAIVYYDFTNGSSTSTGITSAKAATAGKVAYYDISGRRVNAPSKGLYIKQVIAADGSKKTVKIMK